MRTRYIGNTLALEQSTSLYSQVLFDPIFTPLFTAALTGIGFSASAAATGAGVLSAIASIALTVGLQYALAPKPPKPEDGRAPKIQAMPHRIYGAGTNRIAGAYMLWESFGRQLYAVIALCGHQISEITRYYLHDDIAEYESDDGSDMFFVAEGDDGRYKSRRVSLGSKLGLVPETAYARFVSELTTSGLWGTNYRGDGQASLAMICGSASEGTFQETFPNGAPQPSVVANMAVVWDFRDEEQDPEDPSTWTFSKNSALILCWHECFNPFGTRRDYTKAILPVLDMWTEEADICDEDVLRAAGGTEKRYECNVWGTTENDPKAISNAIKASCDGWTCERGDGALLFRVGKFREELVVDITDDDIIGHFIQNDVPEEDEINRLVPKFCYPATDYTTSDTDFFEDEDAQLIVGRVLAEDADLTSIQQWRQARRVGLRIWKRLQQKKRGSLDLRLTGINAVYSRWVRIVSTYRLPRLNNVIIENMRSTMSLQQGAFQMEFVKHPDDIDAWTPADDEGSAPPIPVKVTNDTIPTPDVDTVVAVSSGSSVFIRVVLIDPAADDLTPYLSYRVADTGGGVPGAWIEQGFPDAVPDAGLLTLNTNPVPTNTDIEIDAYFKASGGTPGPHSATETISSAVDTVAPLALSAFSATGGVGQFSANFGTLNDTHLATVAIYKVASGGTLNRVTDIVAPRFAVAPGITYSLPITSAAGSFDIYAEPFNQSSVAGPLAGPDAATVT